MVRRRRVVNPNGWIDKLPVPFRVLLRQLATMGYDTTAIFDDLRKGRMPWICPVPTFDRWLNYYRHHRMMEDEISDALFPVELGMPRPSEVFRDFKRAGRNMKRTFEEIRALPPDVQGLLSYVAQPFGGVTAPQLMAFFDAAHRKATGELAEGDLPGKVQALPKSIQRERAEWSESLGLIPGQI